MSEATAAPESGGPSRTRRIAARVLTVVAVLLALVGMVAFYVEHTALDPDGFETVSRNMIENDAIRTQVANTAVDQLYGNVDVEAAIAQRLPPDQQGLAPVLAGISRSGADRAAVAALERPRVQTAWVEVTTRTQRQLVRLLDDKNEFVQTEGGAVVLDLRPIVIQVGTVHNEDPARSRELDVAGRDSGRRACDLASPRAPQERAARARHRCARCRAADAGCAPVRRRLSRRLAREG
jgi:hypothetical protein